MHHNNIQNTGLSIKKRFNQATSFRLYRTCAILIGFCFGWVETGFTKTGDTEQPMHITSNSQSLDITNNIATFNDSVVITQGSINIIADKVIVTTPNGDQNKAVVDAFGSPLKFSQLQDDGKPIEGHANQMRYELESEKITLTGNAFISQLDSNVKGDKIVYLVKEQKMEAKGERVVTILNPKQIQESDAQ